MFYIKLNALEKNNIAFINQICNLILKKSSYSDKISIP